MNRKVYPPCYRVSCPTESLSELKFEKIQPQVLNIYTVAEEPLGSIECTERIESLQTQVGIEPKSFLREEEKLNDVVDHLLMIYPRTPQGLTDLEKVYARTYQDIFNNRQATKFLLPAYKTLNPCFFDWLDQVLN